MVLTNSLNVIRSKFPQLLAAFTATIGFVSDGMHYGWTSPIIPKLQSPDTPISIEESDVVWLENLYLIGTAASLPIAIIYSDKVGRKPIILFSATLHVCAWTLIGFAESVEVLFVARFIAGIATQLSYIGQKMYLSEIADKDVRGSLSTLIFAMVGVGGLLIYSIGPFVSIFFSACIAGSFVVFEISTFFFMPESPYYLLSVHKPETAKKALAYLRTHDISKELEEIAEAVKRQATERGRVIDLFIVPSNRKGLIVTGVLNAACSLSSYIPIAMNIQSILEDADTDIAPTLAAVLFSAVTLVVSLVAVTTVDNFGRRILLTGACFITAISITILATYFAVKNAGHDISPYNWIPVAVIIIYTTAYTYGFGTIVMILEGEVFPTSLKGIGLAATGLIFNVFAVISIYIYQYLIGFGGLHVPFYVFAVFCFLTGIFSIWMVPETQGKTLEEIQFILKGGKFENDAQK